MPGTGSETDETAAPSQSESQSSAATLQAQSQSSATTFHQILPPQPLDLKCSSEIAENWKSWKEKYNNYFIISRLEQESSQYQLAMFKHAIGDDGLKVIKTFSYADGEDSNNWRVVMKKMEKYRIGEVNEIYERYCFNKRDKLPTESVDSFVAEFKTLAKTCNFFNCLRDILIRDRIVLGIKNEQTTKKLLRMKDLTLNRCIDVCGSEEVAEMQMKSLSEPLDNVNQMNSKTKKLQASQSQSSPQVGKKISCKFCGNEHLDIGRSALSLLSTEGLKPDPEKVRAITETPRPEN